MSTDRAKTQQQIFAGMHSELRTWNPKIPESPDRLDPILRILLQLYSSELARIDQRVSDVWSKATNSLLRSLNPEGKRWPVPAHTIMKCEINDPVVEIDPHTRFFFREEREGGQTFFFSPLKTEKLVKATLRRVFFRTGDSLFDLSPTEGGPTSGSPVHSLGDGSAPAQFYFGIAFEGRPADFANSTVFLTGHSNSLKQLRWGHWYPSTASGSFYDDSGFCPGLTCTIDDIVGSGDSDDDWGGLRADNAIFGHLENSFAVIPESFAATWEPVAEVPELTDLMNSNGLASPDSSDFLYWIKVDLPAGGEKQGVASAAELHFDCCTMINCNELTLFKHTGGNQLVEIEIPEHLDSILKITSVVDSNGRNYLPRHRLHTDLTAGSYVLEERDEHPALWFDFSADHGLPPDSITVTYAITAGIDANGIGLGKILDLYESHPGISGGQNLRATGGAIPARTEQQMVDEASVRLRSRDRALTFAEISRWVMSFDPRIQDVTCDHGIERTATGVRRCVQVDLTLDLVRFCSKDEIDLLKTRMNLYLKSRAPINTHFRVEATSK